MLETSVTDDRNQLFGVRRWRHGGRERCPPVTPEWV